MASLEGLNERLTLVESVVTTMRRSNESEDRERNKETRTEQTIRIARENPARSEVSGTQHPVEQEAVPETPQKTHAEEYPQQNRGRFTSYAHAASVHRPGPELFPETARTGGYEPKSPR